MKKINKTLVAGILACSTLNAKAEVSPFSFGLKVGGSLAKLSVNDGAKFSENSRDVKSSMFKNFFVTGGVYGEYAFSDYLGVELGCNYMKQGGVLAPSEECNKSDEENKTEKQSNEGASKVSTSMIIHGIDIPVSLCIYPIGREEGEGFLKLSLGGDFFIPVKHTIMENECKVSDCEKNNLSSFDFGLKFGVGYEFPFGLFGQVNYGFGFLNKFKHQDDNGAIFSNMNELTSAKDRHFTLNLGYNFGSLLA